MIRDLELVAAHGGVTVGARHLARAVMARLDRNLRFMARHAAAGQ